MTHFFTVKNETDHCVSRFSQFSDNDGTPFPQNQPVSVRFAISSALTLNLCLGLFIRSKIIKYLLTVESKKNPINYFIWLDQLNGGFLGLNIVFYAVTIVLPFPLSSIIGYESCNWADLPGSFYLAGSAQWSCTIALIRVLYLKAPQWIKRNLESNHFMVILALSELLYLAAPTLFIAFVDRGSGWVNAVFELFLLLLKCKLFKHDIFVHQP